MCIVVKCFCVVITISILLPTLCLTKLASLKLFSTNNMLRIVLKWLCCNYFVSDYFRRVISKKSIFLCTVFICSMPVCTVFVCVCLSWISRYHFTFIMYLHLYLF